MAPITVNAGSPGFVESHMAEEVRAHYAAIWGTDVAEARRRIEERRPHRSLCGASEVSALVGYLASPAASSVTDRRSTFAEAWAPTDAATGQVCSKR